MERRGILLSLCWLIGFRGSSGANSFSYAVAETPVLSAVQGGDRTSMRSFRRTGTWTYTPFVRSRSPRATEGYGESMWLDLKCGIETTAFDD